LEHLPVPPFFESFFPRVPLDLGRQFGGGPLSGHWSWLDQGGQTSDQWTAGEGWNMKYDFCFRDEARLEGDGLMTAGTPGNIFFTGKHMKLQVSVLMGKGIQRMGQEGF